MTRLPFKNLGLSLTNVSVRSKVILLVPYDDDDAIKHVVGVPQVVEGAESSELQDHLHGEHAGENDVADLQHVGELLRLTARGRKIRNSKRKKK